MYQETPIARTPSALHPSLRQSTRPRDVFNYTIGNGNGGAITLFPGHHPLDQARTGTHLILPEVLNKRRTLEGKNHPGPGRQKSSRQRSRENRR
jgi:hypothetical protein